MNLFVLSVNGTDATDIELAIASQQGDHQAFGKLVRRYQKRVYAICRRMSGSHDIADDLTQEAFIKAFQAIDSYDPHYPFVGWIIRITINNAINYLKRQRRQLGSEESEIVLNLQTAPESESNPQVRLRQEKIAARLQTAIKNLTPEYRAVFVLRMEEELSYDQIAAALGISVGTVMSRLHRARKKLLEQLGDLLE